MKNASPLRYEGESRTLEAQLGKVGSLSSSVSRFWKTVWSFSEALTTTSQSSIYRVAAWAVDERDPERSAIVRKNNPELFTEQYLN